MSWRVTCRGRDEIVSRLPKTPDRELVRLYCKLIGELMFVAINTQPLITHSVNALALFMSNANHELYILAKGVLRYLAGHKDRKITWCAQCVKYPFHPCELYAYQIPGGRMLFHLAKTLNAIWFSVITLFLVGRPHLLLSLQCLLPRQNSLLYVHALLMSRIVAK